MVSTAREKSLSQLILELRPGVRLSSPPTWPPDAFAIAAAALQQSGAYTAVIQNWPPAKQELEDWVDFIRRTARSWRKTCVRSRIPQAVRKWWRTVSSNHDRLINDLPNHPEVCQALLQILAAADEASAGVGLIPDSRQHIDLYRERADDLLWETTADGQNATLCDKVPPSRGRVLPKLHTPQSGITLRSLSHHLAYSPPNEVYPCWLSNPVAKTDRHGFNLLILPWPKRTTPANFQPVPPDRAPIRNMPPDFGFFEYTGKLHPDWMADFDAVFKRATEEIGRIDGVVFPELALRPGNASELYSKIPKSDRENLILIAGIGQPAQGSQPGRNRALLVIPMPTGEDEPILIAYEQEKHHRWRLDASQIAQYGLGGRLDPNWSWWENTAVNRRQLSFVALNAWLTACCLVCEDLARVDPVSEIIRSVGPNLVIALLLDGPQLAKRWPARYATVLADDPGCAVLTVTNLGMAELSRPVGQQASRCVALWKDGVSGGTPVEIDLPSNADGVVLALTQDFKKEWAADGRDDTQVASYVRLTGVHPVSVR